MIRSDHYLFLVLLVLCFSVCGCSTAKVATMIGEAASESGVWSSARGGPEKTSQGAALPLHSLPKMAWERQIPPVEPRSTLDGAIASADLLFLLYSEVGNDVKGSRATLLVCIDMNSGDEHWQKRFSASADSMPFRIALHEKWVFLGSGNQVLCLNGLSGDEIWAQKLKVASGNHLADLIACGDAVLVGVSGGPVVCLAPDDGALRWKIDRLPGAVLSAEDGRGYAAVEDGTISCFDFGGKMTWTRSLPEIDARRAAAYHCALARDALVCPVSLISSDFKSRNGIVVLDRSGRALWSTAFPADVRWETAVGEDCLVLASLGKDTSVFELSSGRRRWRRQMFPAGDLLEVALSGQVLLAIAPAQAQGLVLSASELRTGRSLWSLRITTEVRADSALLIAGGRVIVVTGGNVFCLKPSTGRHEGTQAPTSMPCNGSQPEA